MAYSEQRGIRLRNRTSAPRTPVFDRTTQQLVDFLWTELRVGTEFVKLASISRNVAAAGRRRAGARKAHDTALKMLSTSTFLPESVQSQLRSALRGLKQKLEKLGETFSEEPSA